MNNIAFLIHQNDHAIVITRDSFWFDPSTFIFQLPKEKSHSFKMNPSFPFTLLYLEQDVDAMPSNKQFQQNQI